MRSGLTLKALKALVLGGVVPTTVTLKLPLAVFSALSVAVQLTVVVPVGKVVPEAGVQFGVTAPSTRSVAEAVKVTTAPEASVASVLMSAGRFSTGGVVSTTRTTTVSVAVPPRPSSTVSVTVWVPSGSATVGFGPLSAQPGGP